MDKNIKGILIDGCGSDERFYQMGLYTDLCGMSVEDYINSTKCNCGGVKDDPSDEPVEPVKPINTVTITTNSNGNLIAYLTYAPTHDISVTCECDGNQITFLFLAGNNDIVVSDYIVTSESILVTNVSMSLNEDDEYKYGDYTIINKSNSTNVYVTQNMVMFNDLNTLSGSVASDTLVKYEVDSDGIAVTFEHELLSSDDVETDEDYELWLKENSFVPVLLIEQSKFKSGEIKIFVNNNDRTETFTEIDTIAIDGVKHSVIVNYTTDESDLATKFEYKGIFVIVAPGDDNSIIKYVIKNA